MGIHRLPRRAAWYPSPVWLEKVARSAGWGVGRIFDPSAFDPSPIARTSARTDVAAHLLLTPHPAFGRLPRFVEKGSLKRAVTAFASTLLIAAANAQQSADEGSVLSPGRQFAEQGGAAIYANVCAACHQRDGKGAAAAGVYPALAYDPKLASADYALRVLLEGSNAMPPLGGMMSDEQAADVINYVRTHFGNDYRDAVTVAAVKSARPPGPQGR
jgi:mono/diheme cytochrome c family protein